MVTAQLPEGHVLCRKMSLRDKIKEFVDFIDNPSEDNKDAKLLRLADQILFFFAETPDRYDDNDYPDTPKHDYQSKRKEVSNKFCGYGFYNLPDMVSNNIANTEIQVGDAIDDIVDLYHDFCKFIWRYENTSQDDAIWYFQNPDRLHWEEHLRNLQYYLFHKIDEENFTEQSGST